jgi:WD40 repeat protein
MAQSPDPGAAGGSVEQSATAYGDAQVNQAAGDLYYAARDLFVYGGGQGRQARHADPADNGGLCPYPGLAPFGVDQAQWYFGREPLINDVITRLAAGSPLAVVGPSGSGKSSLLMAGLRPALTHGRFPEPGSQLWPQLVLTPTAHPVTALARCLATVTGEGTDAVREALSADPGGYAARLGAALAAQPGDHPQRLVVIVDQLEELFTLCGDEAERRRFIDAVSRMASPAVGPAPSPALFVLGLRADFYGHAIANPQLRGMLQGHQVLVGPMTEGELRSAIVDPAAATGLAMEPGLEELLLRDLGVFPGDPTVGDPDPDTWFTAGRLPLLAHALQATWVRRSRNLLTVADYQATGGIRQAISTTAEDSYSGLDDAARKAAEALFLRLVRIGQGAEDTRRRATLAELATDGSAASATAAALTAFTRARLLTLDGDRAATRVTVQISHEALIRAWPRLRRWIDRGRSDILVRQELEEAARAWSEHGRSDNALLYRGSRLEQASAAGTTAPNHLSQGARDFLTASALQAARTARLRRSVIAMLTALVLIASGTAAFALQQRASAQSQRDTARKERDTAIAGQVAIEADRVRTTDPSLAARLDLASYRMRPDDDKYTSLLSWENGPLSTPVPGAAAAPAFSGDGRRMATRAADGSVSVWDSRDPAHPHRLGRPVPGLPSGTAVRLSRDGRILVVYAQLSGDSDDGSSSGSEQPVTLELWDVSDPALFRRTGTLPATGATRLIGFSPDGREFVTADFDVDANTTTLWNITDPAHPLSTVRPGTAVALSRDGRTLAVWEDGSGLQLVDISRPGRFEELLPEGLQVGATLPPQVAFSAGGRWLATAGDPGGNGTVSALSPTTVGIWDLSDRTRPALHNEHQFPRSAVLALALRPDGQVLATAGVDRTVTLWRVTDTGVESSSLAPESLTHPLREMYTPLGGHTDSVDDLEFAPDGAAMASTDGATVRVWSLPHRASTEGGEVDSLAVTHGGHVLVTGIVDNSSAPASAVGLWDLADRRGPVPVGRLITGPDSHSSVFAVSPDGRTLATVGWDGSTINLWSLVDAAHPTLLSQAPGEESGTLVDSLAFTADGGRLWSHSVLRTALWNVTDRKSPRLIDTASPVGDLLASSADGRLTVSRDTSTGTTEGLRLWGTRDAAEPVVLSTLPASDHGVIKAVFSADGHTLAVSHDRTVQLWNVSDPRRPVALGDPMTGHGDEIQAVAFVPRTPLLATAGRDDTVRLWDISDPHHPAAKGRPLPAPGAGPLGFTPDGRTMITADVAGTVRLWDLNVEHAAARICATTENVLTPAVWSRHFPDIPYQRTCP